MLDMKYTFFSTLTLVLGRFFHGSGSGSGFLADPDPDSEKKADLDPGKKPGSETLPTVCMHNCHYSLFHISHHKM